MIGNKGSGAGAERSCFRTIEPGGVDHLLKFSLGNRSEGGGVGAASKKSRGDLIHPLIGALG